MEARRPTAPANSPDHSDALTENWKKSLVGRGTNEYNGRVLGARWDVLSFLYISVREVRVNKRAERGENEGNCLYGPDWTRTLYR